MEERFWLRHHSLASVLGPYTIEELRSAIQSSALPIHSKVLLDTGQPASERDSSGGWQPVTALLGMPEPPPEVHRPKPPGERSRADEEAAATRRLIVRTHTSYSTARSLVSICAFVGIIITIVEALIVLTHARTPGEVTLLTLSAAAFEVIVIIIVAAALQALFDIADCSLRNDQRS